jgi:hypothetical protein
MIKRSVIGGAVAALAVAAFALAPADVAAKGFRGGGHLHASHIRNAYLPYGGPVATYTPGYYAQPVTLVPVQINSAPAAAAAPHCTHSRETITVPAEDGGERQVTITRC